MPDYSIPAEDRTSFVSFLRAAGKSSRTCDHYTSYVDRLYRFRDQKEGRRPRISLQLAREFLTDLIERTNVASSTYRIAWNALRWYFGAYRGGNEKQVISKLGPRPKTSNRRQAITVLTYDQATLLFCSMSNLTHRFGCMLLYGTGMRISECCALRREDIDWERGRIRIRRQKNGGGRWAVLGASLTERLSAHLQRFPGSDWVFPSPKNPERHLCPSSLQGAIVLARKACDLPAWVTPHTLRHSYATHQLQAKTDVRAVQQLLGHECLQTTMRYLHFLDMDTGQPTQPVDLIAFLLKRHAAKRSPKNGAAS